MPSRRVAYERTAAVPVAVTARHDAVGGHRSSARVPRRRRSSPRTACRDDTGEVVDATVEYGRTRPPGSPVRPARPASSLRAGRHRDAARGALLRRRRSPGARRRPDGGVHAARVRTWSHRGDRPSAHDGPPPSTRTGRVVPHRGARRDRVCHHLHLRRQGRRRRTRRSRWQPTRFAYDLLGRLLRSERPGCHADSSSSTRRATPWRPVRARTVAADFDVASRHVTVRHDAGRTRRQLLQFTYHDNGAPTPADAGAHTRAAGWYASSDERRHHVRLRRAGSHRDEAHARTGLGPRHGSCSVTHRSDGLLETITYPGGAPVS